MNMHATLQKSGDSLTALTPEGHQVETGAYESFVSRLQELRCDDRLTPCVGKIAAAVVVLFGGDTGGSWANFGADAAVKMSNPKLAAAYQHFLDGR